RRERDQKVMGRILNRLGCFYGRCLARGLLGIIFIGLGAQNGQSFTVPIHRIITTNSLRTITVVVGGQLRTFSDQALDEIANANAQTDYGISAAVFFPEGHFTNEKFDLSSTRLVDYKNA